jgi:hypothetical protein
MSNSQEWPYISGKKTEKGVYYGDTAQISPCGKFILTKEYKEVAGHNAAGGFPSSCEINLISTESLKKTKLTE